ncbi:multicopper oxidase family protein [Rhizobium sp. C4]|uniref:multicopper oxidase family protein n=1 Tax=Rhizobium sp. C4 TaxID=1349800 RepID=UPI001E39358A|nr:multicopper oxidase domain-containing protein [Rhizobium sp. C4]MCD2173252.1 multicopper oxidase domain-containing protein [Rhizobium sp. C4]
MNRRDFLKTASLAVGGLAASQFVPRIGRAAPAPRQLTIDTRILEVNGKPATVYGLTENGKPGLTFAPGERFSVSLNNRLKEDTIIHWHGLTPPWEQDGVADNPLPMLKGGETRPYDFALEETGTFWMHAHTLQEQNLLAAPLIVHSKEDAAADRQEVVILLHDFSFKPAEELLSTLTGGKGGHMMHGAHQMDHGSMGKMSMQHDMTSMGSGHDMSAMGGMGAMDLNDIEYDAYLANDRTLDDPEIVTVEKGGRIRLRIINGAASTAFHLTTGKLAARLVAVDGHAIVPMTAETVPISMGQRIDLDVEIPKDDGAFPILALREGTGDRTGIVLATPGAKIDRLAAKIGTKTQPLDLTLESALRSTAPLANRPADKALMAHLSGDMASYQWALAGLEDLKLKSGERVEIAMMNMSMMAHPMHLHGHAFQVVAIDGQRMAGAVRDTVLVPPMKTVTIAFDAGKPGHWPFHCHHLYHMVTGMMTHIEVA